MDGLARAAVKMKPQHPLVPYAELHCLSNFSFLKGASHPEELVKRAAELGYHSLAITDECTLAGIVRAHVATREHPVKLIVGCEIMLTEQPAKLILLAPSREAYAELCDLITLGRRRASKGSYTLYLQDVIRLLKSCLVLWSLPYTIDFFQHHHQPADTQQRLPKPQQYASIADLCCTLKTGFNGRLWIAVADNLTGDTTRLQNFARQLSANTGVPIVATGHALMHTARRKPLQDTLTAIKHGTALHRCGYLLQSNHENYLRPYQKLQRLFPEEWLQESLVIAEKCHFSLDSLRYEYPQELVPKGTTATSHLRQLVFAGVAIRYPDGLPDDIRQTIEKELALIAELAYEHYFLTVYDIVRFARSQNILCQGRGSAANSVVCYCLMITEVNPAKITLLFERFISKERNEPPDIDVDFEHERREEVIQYIYQTYGRSRAALAATVITYRGKSAIREVGKALDIDPSFLELLISNIDWRDKEQHWLEQIRHYMNTHALATAQPENVATPHTALLFVTLVNELTGFPRHLSQHVGGFVISAGKMSQLVPIENASMPGRTVIQWDKDDLEALGLLKIDILALGMLSAIRKTLDMVRQFQRGSGRVEDIPREDPGVYAMLQQGDSVGVFQVESRAQTNMLPRLKPQNYYDLVIQVAIVRPGPIQGDMVHPYLRRRQGKEKAEYPNEAIKAVLERTLGVPIFQEQVIKLAMVAAGFSAGEADQLRRAMASWKRHGKLALFQKKLISGMVERGHDAEFAERICRQISGFGEYGFPESHAASFALLVYISAWLKCYEPAAFCCGLLNSQPMGFYSPSQLIQDAQRHNVVILPLDINHSDWDHQLEKHVDSGGNTSLAIRLGLRIVRRIRRQAIDNLLQHRPKNGYRSLEQLSNDSDLYSTDLEILASAGALRSLAKNRYRARWDILAMEPLLPVFSQAEITQDSVTDISNDSAEVFLSPPSEADNLIEDLQSLGLSLERHPLAMLRTHPKIRRCQSALSLLQLSHGTLVSVAGLVVGRQRPGTATGVTFVTLEDETGNINVVVWLKTARAQRQALLTSRALIVTGIMERSQDIIHIIAGRLTDITNLLTHLARIQPDGQGATIPKNSRDFH